MEMHEIDSIVDQHYDNFSAVDSGTSDFCNVYNVARPIIGFLQGLLFFKPKWQQILKILVTSLDANCAVSVPGGVDRENISDRQENSFGDGFSNASASDIEGKQAWQQS